MFGHVDQFLVYICMSQGGGEAVERKRAPSSAPSHRFSPPPLPLSGVCVMCGRAVVLLFELSVSPIRPTDALLSTEAV